MSHFFVKYVRAILLAAAAWILVGRWWRARKVKDKPRRLQFGLRSVLGMVAVFAAIIALLNAWFVVPYQAEQRAATALTQLGGKIVMVDTAPPWLRSYVGKDILKKFKAYLVSKGVDFEHPYEDNSPGTVDANMVQRPRRCFV